MPFGVRSSANETRLGLLLSFFFVLFFLFLIEDEIRKVLDGELSFYFFYLFIYFLFFLSSDWRDFVGSTRNPVTRVSIRLRFKLLHHLTELFFNCCD